MKYNPALSAASKAGKMDVRRLAMLFTFSCQEATGVAYASFSLGIASPPL